MEVEYSPINYLRIKVKLSEKTSRIYYVRESLEKRFVNGIRKIFIVVNRFGEDQIENGNKTFLRIFNEDIIWKKDVYIDFHSKKLTEFKYEIR